MTDAISDLMRREGLGFPEAVEKLSEGIAPENRRARLIDGRMTRARMLAEDLNEILDALEDIGVTATVVGAPPYHNIDVERVRLQFCLPPHKRNDPPSPLHVVVPVGDAGPQ